MHAGRHHRLVCQLHDIGQACRRASRQAGKHTWARGRRSPGARGRMRKQGPGVAQTELGGSGGWRRSQMGQVGGGSQSSTSLPSPSSPCCSLKPVYAGGLAAPPAAAETAAAEGAACCRCFCGLLAAGAAPAAASGAASVEPWRRLWPATGSFAGGFSLLARWRLPATAAGISASSAAPLWPFCAGMAAQTPDEGSHTCCTLSLSLDIANETAARSCLENSPSTFRRFCLGSWPPGRRYGLRRLAV